MTGREFAKLVRDTVPQWLPERGRVFFSSAATLTGSARPEAYLMGVNPGGDECDGTIDQDLELIEAAKHPPGWSAYHDECWLVPGRSQPGLRIQTGVKNLARFLVLDLRMLPATNLVFARSPKPSDLKGGFGKCAEEFWNVHRQLLEVIRPRMLVVYGAVAFKFVRRQLSEEKAAGTDDELQWRKQHCRAFAWNAPWCESSPVLVLGLPHVVHFPPRDHGERRTVQAWIDGLRSRFCKTGKS